MRLVAAARILAHLESVKRDAEKDGGDGDRRFMAVLPQPRVRKHLLPNLRPGRYSELPKDPQEEHSSQGLLLDQKSSWEGVLRNPKRKHGPNIEDKLKNVQLCDPTLDEADVGLLSCGFNYYCAESHDSYLGGVCIEAANGINQQPRRLEDGSDGEFDFVAACDPNSPNFSKCDCTMFDTVSGDGYIQCLYYDNYCLKECPTLCLDLHVGKQLTSNMTNSDTDCYNFFGSYEREICYTSLEDGCSISFDGATCNSCEPVTCNPPNITDIVDPFAWDCANVPGGTQGSYCNENEYFIPALAFPTGCPRTNSTPPEPTSAAPSASVVPSASTEPTWSNAPMAMEVDSVAPTAFPTTNPPTPEPLVTNAPVVAAAPPTTTTTSGSGYYYGAGSSVWTVVVTSLVAGVAIALGTTGG